MAFDPILAIRRAAMVAVHRETFEYRIREIQRWFSETFHTPLAAVEDMEFEYLCMHYFERTYRDMDAGEREDELRELCLTEDQRIEKLRREEADKISDAEFLQQVKAEAERAAAGVRKLAGKLANLPREEQEPIVPVPVMGSSIPTTFQEQSQSALKVPEGIEMQFVSEEEMDDMEGWDLFGPPKKAEK